MAGSYVNGGGNVSETPILRLDVEEETDLFTALSANIKSPIIVVKFGKGVLLSAFGLQTGEDIKASKLLLKHPDSPDGDGCKDKIDINPKSDIVKEEIVNCGKWALSECSTLLYLTTPGTYQLHLSDQNMLGRVLLTAQGVISHAPYVDILAMERQA